MKKYLETVIAILPMVGFVLIGCQPKEEDPRTAGFNGKVAKTFEESEEHWPEEPTFTGDEPNVLLILLDDVGYAQLGAFGGLTETPNVDALAGNTPFNHFKQVVHRGGIQDPLIVHWPAGIRGSGEVRNQYHHIIDIGPTIMDVWELYNVAEDFTESKNLADEFPEELEELKAAWDEDKTGTVTLFVNGKSVGQGQVSRTHPGQFSLSETFDVGEDTGTPVSKSYTRENAFSGNLDKIVVALKQN